MRDEGTMYCVLQMAISLLFIGFVLLQRMIRRPPTERMLDKEPEPTVSADEATFDSAQEEKPLPALPTAETTTSPQPTQRKSSTPVMAGIILVGIGFCLAWVSLTQEIDYVPVYNFCGLPALIMLVAGVLLILLYR